MNWQILFKCVIIIVSILTIQTITLFGQDCEKLADGVYVFKHKTRGHKKADFVITLNGDRYTLKNDGQESKGEIQWWPDNCMFKLNADNQVPVNIDSLDSFEKTLMKTSLSYGGGCYELTDKGKFRLTYCGNLHITMSEGRIKKKGR